MGAGASNSQKTGNDNVDRTMQKMAVVGALRASSKNSKTLATGNQNNQKEVSGS